MLFAFFADHYDTGFCTQDLTGGHLLFRREKRTAVSINAIGVGKSCKKVMERAGVDGTTHSLRREFITTAYRADAQLIDIMRIVGHTNPRQTAKYIENDIEKMRESITLRKDYISEKTMT